jgi:hypothetical protein
MKRFWVVLVAACGGGGGFPTDSGPEAPVAGGKFSLAWTLKDTNNQAITCGQVGGNFVSVTLRNRAVSGASVESFSCASAMATSLLSFTPGIYDISFELTGTVGQLAVATTVLAVEIKANETAVVPPVTFTVDATGKLSLAINTGESGGNCNGGAGVDNFTITLQHTGAACEPVTFNITPGNPSSYTVDCDNPVLANCIDNTQTLAVPSLPSGSYRIVVKGLIGGVDCWTTTQTIVVPPLSKTLTQTLNLTHQTTSGC